MFTIPTAPCSSGPCPAVANDGRRARTRARAWRRRRRGDQRESRKSYSCSTSWRPREGEGARSLDPVLSQESSKAVAGSDARRNASSRSGGASGGSNRLATRNRSRSPPTPFGAGLDELGRNLGIQPRRGSRPPRRDEARLRRLIAFRCRLDPRAPPAAVSGDDPYRLASQFECVGSLEDTDSPPLDARSPLLRPSDPEVDPSSATRPLCSITGIHLVPDPKALGTPGCSRRPPGFADELRVSPPRPAAPTDRRWRRRAIEAMATPPTPPPAPARAREIRGRDLARQSPLVCDMAARGGWAALRQLGGA